MTTRDGVSLLSPAAQKFAHDMLDGMTIIDAAKRLDQEIAAAVAVERAAFAKIAQEFCWPGGMDGMQLYLRDCIAEAIRARRDGRAEEQG
jgi:hypothetical protein